MSKTPDFTEYLTKEFGHLIGQTIKAIRPLYKEEIADLYWHDGPYEIPFIIIFENGEALIPSADPEGNGPGWLFTASVAPVTK